MADQRILKLARLCIRYSVDVKPKESVLIQGSNLASPLITEIFKQCLLADAHPLVIPNLDLDYLFYKHAKEHQLEFVSPFVEYLIKNIDVSIGVWCQPNPKGLSSVDPAKIRKHTASRREIRELFNKRAAEGKLKWTGLPYPINAQAQEAAMSLVEYEDFVYNACLVNKKDPIEEWKKVHERQERICEILSKTDGMRIVGEDTDLSFSVKGRKWINSSGQRNMPSGEVFTAPLEESVNGTIRFTFPGIVSGREVEDIRLTFKDGKVVKALAAKGDELLKQMLKIEGADRIGEAAIGTNYSIAKFTKNMLFDEKMGGTIHIALGNSYPESGGLNKSAVHWDILKDMKRGEIFADEELIYRDGRFTI